MRFFQNILSVTLLRIKSTEQSKLSIRSQRNGMPKRTSLHFLSSNGITLVEMLVVIAIITVLGAIAIPQILKTLQSESKAKSAASKLAADLETAQTEALRRGDGGLVNGILVRRSVFVVFDDAANSYSIWAYEDTNGNNKRDAGEAIQVSAQPISLIEGISFGVVSSVNKKACGNIAEPVTDVISFGTQNDPPCGGKRCVELNAKGFPVSPSAGGTIYLTNNTDSMAVNLNSAGLITRCKWSGTAWIVVR